MSGETRTKICLQWAQRVAISAILMLVAAGIQYALWEHLRPLIFIVFYPAVVIAILLGEPYTAILFAAILAQFFDSPDFTFQVHWRSDLPRHLTFVTFGLMITILGRKRSAAIAALRLERDKLDALVKNVDVGIGLTDARGNTLSLNPAGLAIHGFQTEQEMFQQLDRYVDQFEIQYPDGKVMPLEQWPTPRALRGDYVKNYDLNLVRRSSGESKSLRYSVIPIYDTLRQLKNFVVKIADLTEQKKHERTLAEALRLRDEFLSIASHELKTPLAALKLQLQILERRLRPGSHIVMTPEKIGEKLAPALRQVEALNYLTENLLDVSRIRSGRFALTPERVSLSGIVRMVLEDFDDQLRAAGLKVKQEGEDVIGEWDRARLQQVLVNLLSNCMKYAPNAMVTISSARTDRHGVLTVADTGPGIPTHRQPQIFDAFERGGISHNLGGLGLGLFIVRQIVEAHQGHIRVDSRLGGGTRFTVELPLRASHN